MRRWAVFENTHRDCTTLAEVVGLRNPANVDCLIVLEGLFEMCCLLSLWEKGFVSS